jgi:hypothetical protein
MLNEHPIFVIFVVAVAAPLLAQTRAGSYVPVVVFEVVFGILIGPHGLGVIDYGPFLSAMRSAGMLGVLFMAGMEIDFERIRGRPLSLAEGKRIGDGALRQCIDPHDEDDDRQRGPAAADEVSHATAGKSATGRRDRGRRSSSSIPGWRGLRCCARQ